MLLSGPPHVAEVDELQQLLVKKLKEKQKTEVDCLIIPHLAPTHHPNTVSCSGPFTPLPSVV
ncbi:hypothetical protein E2C01_021863 [Portunus trituberculatus]|uniref:Uncharacterized protein n=1 Tax=Portunus trituberculatus TaxID=210409 RepID=A0A5B7E640_PORTR|nr:hypothetical protein [Portunus trituberculatus]